MYWKRGRAVFDTGCQMCVWLFSVLLHILVFYCVVGDSPLFVCSSLVISRKGGKGCFWYGTPDVWCYFVPYIFNCVYCQSFVSNFLLFSTGYTVVIKRGGGLFLIRHARCVWLNLCDIFVWFYCQLRILHWLYLERGVGEGCFWYGTPDVCG